MNQAAHRIFIALALLATVVAPLSAMAQAPKGKLVLYTSQPERDAAQTMAAFKQAYPGIEVEVFRSGTTEVMGKLAAEFAAGATQGRRAADRRCRQHGGAEERRPAAALSRKRRSPVSRPAPTTPTRPISAPSSSRPASR